MSLSGQFLITAKIGNYPSITIKPETIERVIGKKFRPDGPVPKDLKEALEIKMPFLNQIEIDSAVFEKIILTP